MAVTTYTPTTGTSDVNVAWRKIQGKVTEGAEFFSEEYNWYDDYPVEAIDWSLRETTIPVDLAHETGAGFLSEGGRLMKPSSVNMTELTVPLAQLNARFTASKLAEYANKGMSNQVEEQLAFQSAKKVQAMVRKLSIHMHGSSSGTIALTDANIANATSQNDMALYDAFGYAALDNAAYITSLIKVGERFAWFNGSGIATDAVGYVDTIDSVNGDIDFTYDTTATAQSADGLKLVGAQALNAGTTVTNAETDYEKAINGWADFLNTANLHGINATTYTNWAPGSDTTGGRLTSDRLWKAAHTIQNNGGGKMNTVQLSQGVWRDLVKQEGSLVRHDSPKGMEIDGSVKMAGVTFKMSKYCFPQHAICYDKKSIRKISLLPKPSKSGGLTWKDGKELIDQDGYVFEVNMVIGLFNTNRANVFYFSGLTES